MAAIVEYFETDFPHVVSVTSGLPTACGGRPLLTLRFRIHVDFDAGVKSLSVYLPDGAQDSASFYIQAILLDLNNILTLQLAADATVDLPIGRGLKPGTNLRFKKGWCGG